MATSGHEQHTDLPGSARSRPLRTSPLAAQHRALGARMVDFAGWQMPLEYAGGGIVAEHRAVRTAAGLFDVSHLGKLRITGPGAADFVNTCLTGDLTRIAPGQAQYTLCCDDGTGGIVDDLIAYLHGPREVVLIPNAANAADVRARLEAEAPRAVRVIDEHDRYAVLAVQGPRSDDVLGAVGLPAGHPYMSFRSAHWTGRAVTVCRSGYTGERGYELLIGADDAPPLWEALLADGARHGLRPAGLGARDTLRTEMGYPLHGQDISLDTTPVQAGLSWAVGWSKPRFWGRDVLAAERERGPGRRLRGLDARERAIPRPGMTVRAGGVPVGRVTSGTFSPTLERGIGLALLDAGVHEGDEVEVDVRGRAARFGVRRPPFVDASPRD